MQPANWDYTRLEFERKFLVDRTRLDFSTLESYSKLLEDRYFDFGRVRLRRQTDSDTGLVKFKLTKKFDTLPEISDGSAGVSAAGAPGFVRRIVSMWVSESEYSALLALPARELRKRRHYFKANGWTYGVDVFERELEGLTICEFEGEDKEEVFRIPPPEFATVEVTEDVFFTGGNLCRATAMDVKARVSGSAIS